MCRQDVGQLWCLDRRGWETPGLLPTGREQGALPDGGPCVEHTVAHLLDLIISLKINESFLSAPYSLP